MQVDPVNVDLGNLAPLTGGTTSLPDLTPQIGTGEGGDPFSQGGALQTGLNTLGMFPVPGLSSVANLGSAGISAYNGHWGSAAASLVFAAPLIGSELSDARAIYELGREGEIAAQILKNTQRIDSITRTAGYRIPDELNEAERIIGEVKNAPSNFWEKLNHLPAVRQPLAKDLKSALEKTLPEPGIEYKVVRRQAGLGSLGQERFVAIAKWQGGCIAREAKLMVPSACSWLNEKVEKGQPWYEKAISSAVRSPDPFQLIDGFWLIRRLSPDSNPIDIQTLPKHSDEEMLLNAMGTETANVHLGTNGQTKKILKDLKMRKRDWLHDAAVHMAKVLEKDWKHYRKI